MYQWVLRSPRCSWRKNTFRCLELYLNQFFWLAMQLWIFTRLECFPFMSQGVIGYLVVLGRGDSWFQLWWNLTWCPTLTIFITEQNLRKTTVPCWILLGTCSTGVTVIIIEWWFFGALCGHLGLLSCSSFLLNHGSHAHPGPTWWRTVLAQCWVLADEYARWTELFFLLVLLISCGVEYQALKMSSSTLPEPSATCGEDIMQMVGEWL